MTVVGITLGVTPLSVPPLTLAQAQSEEATPRPTARAPN